LLAAAPASVQALPGGNYEYTINAGNTNTITITNYIGSGGALTIPSNINNLVVTGLGNGYPPVFGSNVTSVTVPASVTSIGEQAFYNCTNLTGITLPDSLTNLGASAFLGCTDLTGITIPSGVSNLVLGVFAYSGLTSVTIPTTVTNIGTNVFLNCVGLTSLTLSSGVLGIAAGAFYGCSSLTSITIPGSINDIGSEAFFACSKATNVTISNGVTSIEQAAFSYCTGLDSVTIPASITNIGTDAFAGCAGLTGIYFQGNAPGTGSDVFESDPHAIAYYLPGTTGWSNTFAGIPAVEVNLLQVIISPAAAITNGAQWQVDGGAWQNSGATLTNMSSGAHSVSVNAVIGYVFDDWTSNSIPVSESTNYSFILTSNLTLVANYLATSATNTGASTSLSGNLAFGGVAIGSSAQGTLTISNNGNLPVTISNISYPLGYSGSTALAPIATDGATNITVTFSPEAATTYFGKVTVTSDATNGVETVPVSGYGASGTSVLTVITNGSGKVTPASLIGKPLKLGGKYVLTATPNTRNVFSNWTGSINATNNPLHFVMSNSTVLQANFVTNPFLPVAGTYNGLFSVSNGVTEQTAGMLKGLTISQKGTYSGSVIINGATHPVSGPFNLFGQASKTIPRPTAQGGPLLLQMTLDWNSSPPEVTGTVSGTNNEGPWMATNLLAELATNTVPSGEYTMLIPPDTNNAPPTSSPGGDGYALITNHLGKATLVGALADGTAYSQAVPVSQTGDVPFYTTLYGGKGLIMGWLNLTNTNSVTPTGLTWIHPGHNAGLYPKGFTNVLLTNQILLSPWKNPGSFAGLTNLSVLATVNDTNALSSNTIAVASSGKVTGNLVSGTLNLKTGLLTVTVGSGAGKISGHGAMLNATNGAGYFLTKDNGQAIEAQ